MHTRRDPDYFQVCRQGWYRPTEHQGVHHQLQDCQHGQGGREQFSTKVSGTEKVFAREQRTEIYIVFPRRVAQPPPPPDKQDKAEMAFKLYDKDKDGYITKGEMVKLSKTLTKEQVEKVRPLFFSMAIFSFVSSGFF